MTEEKQILIVERDHRLSDTMALLLERVGYRVLRSHEAGEALDLAKRATPDLLIVDSTFRGLLSRLCDDEALRHTPVILMIGLGQSVEPPCPPLHTVLEKPFRPDQLLGGVEEMLALGSSAGERSEATILVVDDDPDFSQIVARILEANGYHVLTAANGAEAWRRMQEATPDLVLLDVMMSTVLDGLSVSQGMRDDPRLRDVPVLMVSSIADTEYAAAFPTDRDVHMDAWISKPVDPQTLLAKVREHLP